ncbi:ATP-binding protein [Sphingobacterium sp. SGG-5]|uniref:AlbA family DNA-binding domain-containing protein n=1 Tax=Sphingobacterium sp. SGG-5 TaxID=2710881 RepID=UPI0013EE0683|nr:ATP-binding protein [Sphingobacterium sp. SGG-5]NGM61966.1 ATP-binding protein [Sphingobacterium sp. SGG-5]
MTDGLFKKLIDNSEGRLLDYKICCYNFQSQKEEADAKFVKDIISFSNTVRDNTAYIIFGVKEESNGIKSLVGITDFPDDAIFQQKTKSRIFPSPTFSSYKYNYDGKLFGVIEIPLYSYARPLVATQKLKGLQIDKIYLRQGSSNEEATHTQTEELIDWLKNLKPNNSTTDRIKEIDDLISSFSDTSQKLSALFGKCNSFCRSVNNPEFNSFVSNELNGLRKSGYDQQEYNYRIIRAPVTPYTIQIPSFGRKNADQMIEYFFE